jgi:Transposase DDE domain
VPKKRQDEQGVREEDVQGLKYFERLAPLLERLHDVGCQRDKAGNRTLHYDQYCLLILLYYFNPIVDSMRGLSQASELRKVQKKLGCSRASLGSLSESVAVFDPALLEPIIGELAEQLRPFAKDPRLKEVRQVVELVDGTLLRSLPQLAAASWGSQQPGHRHYAWRLHTHFEVERHVPTRMTLTDARGSGKSHEREVLRCGLQADRCYVLDRGYFAFRLFDDIVAAGSSYVCRIQENLPLEVEREYALSQEAREAGVIHDAVVQRRGLSGKRPQHPVRVVTLEVTPHRKRSGHKGNAGPGNKGLLLIATNLLDVPAEVIALLYQYRWLIEIFFRFFKHVLGCRHLLSHDPVGIQIQAYCAIIACMLISLWTGRKPTRRTYEMICYYLIGWAEEEELLAHLAKLNAHDDLQNKK